MASPELVPEQGPPPEPTRSAAPEHVPPPEPTRSAAPTEQALRGLRLFLEGTWFDEDSRLRFVGDRTSEVLQFTQKKGSHISKGTIDCKGNSVRLRIGSDKDWKLLREWKIAGNLSSPSTVVWQDIAYDGSGDTTAASVSRLRWTTEPPGTAGAAQGCEQGAAAARVGSDASSPAAPEAPWAAGCPDYGGSSSAAGAAPVDAGAPPPERCPLEAGGEGHAPAADSALPPEPCLPEPGCEGGNAAPGDAGREAAGTPAAAAASGQEAATAKEESEEELDASLREAELLSDRGEFVRARDICSIVIEKAYHRPNPNIAFVAEAVRLRATTRLCEGRDRDAMDGALQDAQYALQVDHDNWKSHDTMGIVKLAWGEYDEAMRYFEAARKLLPPEDCDAKERVMEGLAQVQKLWLLTQRAVKNLRRTVMVEWSLADVWKFCQLPATAEPPSPRSFALKFESQHQRTLTAQYVLTVPENHAIVMPDADANVRYPLFVYMHTAGSADIVKGDVQARMVEFLAQEDPVAMLAETTWAHGYGAQDPAAVVSKCFGLAPCCPTFYGSIREDAPKEHKKRKLFWFKACDRSAYEAWDFSGAIRVKEVEALVLELIAHVIETLPIDASRIYYVGSSGGGYGVLRLAELVPQLPAAVVPMAGYYPVGSSIEDHDVSTLADRLKDVPLLWALHCERDAVCRVTSPHVQTLFTLLSDFGKEVEWIEPSIAKGKNNNFHSAACYVTKYPEHFFRKVLAAQREGQSTDTALLLLRDRVKELVSQVRPATVWTTALGPAATPWSASSVSYWNSCLGNTAPLAVGQGLLRTRSAPAACSVSVDAKPAGWVASEAAAAAALPVEAADEGAEADVVHEV